MPVPENIPEPARTATTARIGQEWGWMGIDHCQTLENNNVRESLKVVSDHPLEGLSVISMFFLLFPRDIRENIVLVEMNKTLKKKKLEIAFFGQVLQWIWIWVFMSTVSGFRCSDL